jgi:AAT family amino acid transporter
MMILISHIRYRRAVEAGRLPASPFPAPGGSRYSWIALLSLVFVAGLIAVDPDSRVSLHVGAGWAVVLGVGWAVLKNKDSLGKSSREKAAS